ncbi:RNA-binding protein 39 [Cichlidogyrus casuarinus]|uniref:RNA-binding protein 39 n=1 Tax=Cichlidogyrus casuarinus TaxID=1844966 RepID=A0ABD2QLI6_9PLAT
MSSLLDVDALLEEEYRSSKKSKRQERRSKSRSRSRSRSPRRKYDHRGEKYEESRHNRDKRYERDEYSRDKRRDHRDFGRDKPRSSSPILTPLERDARTVYIWQMSSKIEKRDLFDFFSAVGKVRSVRLILDPRTRRSKGIAYVEFREIESTQLAISLSGTKLLGVPLQIQPVRSDPTREAELRKMEEEMKKREAMSPKSRRYEREGPCKVYVGSLHFNINEDMLRGIFEPFGRIDELRLVKGSDGRSQGYGYITYADSDSAKKALQNLDGFELAGRPIKASCGCSHLFLGILIEAKHPGSWIVSFVSDKFDSTNFKILDDGGKKGIPMDASSRLALMAKLAEGTGIEMPKSALAQLHISQQNPALGTAGGVGFSMQTTAPNGTQCFLLSNMFDPHVANNSTFQEIREDVIDECSQYGGILHMFIDKTSAQGNVYVKCPNIAVAQECVNKLHGRYFSKRMITAAYVPCANYHKLFPDSARSTRVINSASQL